MEIHKKANTYLLPLLILSFGLICPNVYSQRVTYRDMIYVLNHDITQSTDYLTNKGFEYTGIDTLSDSTHTYSYRFTKNPSNKPSYISLNKEKINNIFCEVSTFTMYKSDYLKLKESIISEGFKLNKTDFDSQGRMIMHYSKGKYSIIIMITRSSELGATEYYFSCANSVLEESGYHFN